MISELASLNFTSLEEENFNDVYNAIVHSVFINDENFIRHFFKSFFSFFESRTESEEILKKMYVSLYKSQVGALNLLKPMLLESLTSQPKCWYSRRYYSYIRMARYCFDQKMYTTEEIINTIQIFRNSTETSQYHYMAMNLIYTFSDLVKEDENLSNSFLYLLNFLSKNSSYIDKNKNPWSVYFEHTQKLWNDSILCQKIIKDYYFEDTFGYAIRNDDVDFLVSYSAEFNEQLKDAKIACSPFDPHLIKTEFSFIQFAALWGSVKVFRYLLSNKADINLKCSYDSLSTVQCAIIGGSLEILRLCEQENCNFDKALTFAADWDRPEIIQWLLITQDVSEDEIGCALTQALETNRYDVVLAMVEHVSCDEVGERGKTLYHIAANDIELLKFVTDLGCNHELKDFNENTAFLAVCCYPGVDRVKYLASLEGVDFKAKNIRNETALHCAVIRSDIEVINFLLDEIGFNLEETDQEGNTALHLACMRINYDIVEALLKHSPEEILSLQNRKGYTPVMCAFSSLNYNIISLMLEHPGNTFQVISKKDIYKNVAAITLLEDQLDNLIDYLDVDMVNDYFVIICFKKKYYKTIERFIGKITMSKRLLKFLMNNLIDPSIIAKIVYYNPPTMQMIHDYRLNYISIFKYSDKKMNLILGEMKQIREHGP